MKRAFRSVTIAWLTVMFTAILALTSVSAASAEPLCSTSFKIHYNLNPGGYAWAIWNNWSPQVMGGTFIRTNGHQPPILSVVSQDANSIRSGAYNPNSIAVYTEGFGNIIYRC